MLSLITQNKELRRQDILYPELSYQIIGGLFDVYNEIGGGYPERVYQRAVARSLTRRGISFREQVGYPLTFDGSVVGKQYLDFLIEEKIILELKQGDRFRRQNLNQTLGYLRISALGLAILANFTHEGVLFRRLVNIE